MTATLAEDISGMRMVQAFVREQRATENFRAVARDYRDSNMQTVVLNGLYFPFVSLLATLALAVVLGYGGHLYFDDALSLGTLFAFMLYVNNFFDPVQQLSQLYNTFLSATAALDKIIGVLDEEPGDRRPAGRAAAARASRATSASRTSTSGVRRCAGGELGLTEVLHGIDLDVPAGTTVALVGHTGAGKSTIAKLLARFYEPTSGRITIDGLDLNDVTQESLRRQLGIVPQEGFLFAGTVAENIAFGRPDARPEDIVRAAQTVGAHEFILRLEDGYETQLGERGSRLSLGQRQLVAFARALLADPRILILDEATSSVDIGTERTIERALRTLLADRTAFVIAHRLSTIRDADLIAPSRPSARTSSPAARGRVYETHLGERGSRLSLGQRQLVAFARALLADPRILILDEADLVGRHRDSERTIERALTDPPGRYLDLVRHRAPAVDDSRRRPHRRARARTGDRAGLARRAPRPPRAVHEPVRRLGRA